MSDRTDSDVDTDVMYVPGAKNRYEFEDDVVVLDEMLLEYPDAHAHVLQHEIEHANPENQSFEGLVQYEFEHDVERLFSSSDEVQQVREYYRDRIDDQNDEYVAANTLRSLWNFVLRPAGFLYRRITD